MPSRTPKPPSALEARIGYTFADPALLRLALTHRSHTYEAAHGAGNPADSHQRNAPGTDNEQLEFLGDAVLGLLVTEALLHEFPGCSEGELTRLRAALVSRARMAEFGRALGLGEHILLGKGVEQTDGRSRPALLANAAEALLAAMFLDASRSAAKVDRAAPDDGRGNRDPLTVLRPLLERHLLTPDLPHLHAALAEAPHRGALRDSKTLLQELVQAQSGVQPIGKLRYVDLDQSGPPHDRRFTVQVQLHPLSPAESPDNVAVTTGEAPEPPPPLLLATAEGRSKKEAQQAAAALALSQWERLIGSAPRRPAAEPRPDARA